MKIFTKLGIALMAIFIAIGVNGSQKNPEIPSDFNKTQKTNAEMMTDGKAVLAECEDFDDLTVGGYVAGQLGGNWTTWGGAPGTAEDALVSDLYSVSPSNSMLVEGTTDLVHLITGENITEGKWSYGFSIYIPDGTTGYFNLQKDVVPGTEWGFQVMFEDDMTMIVDGGAAAAAVIPYNYDQWYVIEMIVDLDMDWCQFFVDGVLEHEYQWTLGTFGTAGANTLAGANFYANPGAMGTPPGAHFDDVCFEEVMPSPDDCEYFDDLTVGGFVAEQLGGMWTTWSGAPGGPEDAIVSDDYSVSPNNSFVINSTTMDLLWLFDDEPIATGAWKYSHYLYIPSGNSGYFNIQSEPTAGVDWVIELYFYDGGFGEFAGEYVGDFTYEQDTWILIEINLDLDSDLANIYFDGEMILQFDNVLTIGGADYWGWPDDAPPGVYFDDVCFGEGDPIAPPTLDPPENLTVEQDGADLVLDWDAPGGGVTGSLLCVDRDGSADLAFTDDWQFIQPALDALGVMYDYYEVTDLTQDGPDLGTLEQYDIVYWFCGEGWQNNQTLTDNDEANLAAYLDGGGNLLLSAHDYFWDKYPNAGNFSSGQFPYDYLGVASTSQDFWNIFSPDIGSAEGIAGSFGEGVSFDMQDIYTTDKDGLYIDQVVSLDTDLFNVTSPTPSGVAACQFDGGTFKTAYTSISLAAITEQSAIEAILQSALDWMSNGDGTEELLGYNVFYEYMNGGFNNIGYVTETEFVHEDAALNQGIHEYYVTAVYDEGESGPSNTVQIITVSVEENFAEYIEIYPNPAHAIVNINSDLAISNVTIYNFAGQQIIDKRVESSNVQIDLSQVEPGIYLLNINTDKGLISRRVIVE